MPVADPPPRPRTIVTTDGEADDINSFLRLLYYANDMDVVGLVYTSSVHHWQGDGVHTLSGARDAGLVTSFLGETAGATPAPTIRRPGVGSPWAGWSGSSCTHAPTVRLSATSITARPGEAVELSATASDPDGDDLNVTWWCYGEASTIAESPLVTADRLRAVVTLPAGAEEGQRAVVIASVTDSGTPPLTRYGQAVITVVTGT